MYEALAQSMNAPAVWLLNQIGVSRGYDSVKDFNIPVTKKDKNLALALGGMSGGVSPQQMAGAYTAFANGGKIVKPFYIRKSWIPPEKWLWITQPNRKAVRLCLLRLPNK